jgi:hypothetical protein
MVAQTVAQTAQAAGSTQQLVLGSNDDANAIDMVLVKFFFKDHLLIPSGVPKVERAPTYQVDVAHQLEAMRAERKDLARLGRVRKGRVDTGTQAIKVNRPIHAALVRRGLANNGFRLSHLHWFKMDDSSDKQGNQEPMYVVVACMIRSLTNSQPESTHVAALRELANMTWNACFVWENPPGKPATINFRGRAPNQKPKHALVVRDGTVEVEDVTEPLPEEKE